MAVRFRQAIEAQLEAGAQAQDMTLRLTHGDASRLRRDPAVAVSDITYAVGGMRFLGVAVAEGGVAESRLDVDAAA